MPNTLTDKNRIDAVYDARKGLADEIKSTSYRGNIYRSKMPKSVDINSQRCGDPRASNTKVVRALRRTLLSLSSNMKSVVLCFCLEEVSRHSDSSDSRDLTQILDHMCRKCNTGIVYDMLSVLTADAWVWVPQPFPYAKPLGPGSYNNEKLKKHSAPGG